MRKIPWWMAPLVIVVSLLGVLNIAIFTLLPIQPSEKLTSEGLFLNICGAVITLVPDLIGVDKLFEPSEKIERIREAQKELFVNGSLTQEYGSKIYSKMIEIFTENQDVPTPPDRITAKSGGYGVSASVYFQYEKDEADIDVDNPNTWQRHKKERIGPTGVMDSRVSQHIENLKSRGHQLGFALGIFLLLVGFIFQFAATVY